MHSGEAARFSEGVDPAALGAGRLNRASRRVVIWLTDHGPNILPEDVRRAFGRSLAAVAPHTERGAENELLETNATICTLSAAKDRTLTPA